MQCTEILENSKIGIQPDVCNRISSTIQSYIGTPHVEVEARLGYLLDGKAQSGFPFHDSKRWFWLLKLLSQSELYYPGKFSKSIAQLTDKNIRIETLLTDNILPVKNQKVIQTRFTLLEQTRGDVTVKIDLVASKEQPVVDDTNPSILMTREKTRTTFFARDGSHAIEMTVVSGDQPNYEVEVEYYSKNIDLKTFFTPIKLIWASFESVKEKLNIDTTPALRFYNNFFRERDQARFDDSVLFKRSLPQPINLKRWNLNLAAYAVTKKLNGTRMIGIITGQKLYLASMKGTIDLFRTSVRPDLDDTIFDCEFFRNQVYIFDILCLHNLDVRQFNLDKRYTYIDTLVNNLRDKDIIKKEMKMEFNLAEETGKMLNEIRGNANYDGLIFTPITEPYLNFHTYKWKPPHELTIDFAATKIGKDKYILQVGGKKGLVNFTPPGFRGVITLNQFPPKIGEYRWTGSTFVLARARPDKSDPNYQDIAKDVWLDIQYPLTEEELLKSLTGGRSTQNIERDAFRKLSNSIKRDLINSYCAHKAVLDLGAGKGGDLMKYFNVHVTKLTAVEPNLEFLNQLKLRADEMEFRNQRINLFRVHAKAQDTNVIQRALREEKVQVATSFFVLSFFFENEAPLNGLLNTLDLTVEKNGYFIGTTIDGRATYELLRKNNSTTLGNVTLRKMYQDFSGPILFNKAVEYQYAGSQTVADIQVEYLVDWDYFVAKMGSIGFRLEKSSIFQPPSWLTLEEQELAKLYRSFIFVREDYFALPTFTARFESKQNELAIPILESGKNKVFTTFLEEKGLVRTGVPQDGNSFFHAIQTALSLEYRKMNLDQKKSFVMNWRKTVTLPLEKWKQLGEGRIARREFDALVNYYLTNTNEGFLGRRANLVWMMGNQYQLEKQMLRLRDDRVVQNKYLDAYKKEVENILTSHAMNKTGISAGLFDLRKIFELSEQTAYQNFLDNLAKPGSDLGLEGLTILSSFIRYDIYLLDEDGRPLLVDCSYTDNRPSLVLISFRSSPHYETIGRIGQNNVIHRIFSPDDPLIQAIRGKIC